MSKSDSGDKPSSKLDYMDTDTTRLQEQPFPVSIRTTFRVYFEENAYRAMMEHATTTTEVELGGVLVGRVLRDAVGPYLRIVGSIPAEGARNRDVQNHIHARSVESHQSSSR